MKECDPGYICEPKSSISNPTDGIQGQECPAGGYCEQGATELTQCIPGTFSNAKRQTSQDSCVNCPPGQFCDSTDSTKPTGECDPGFYCEAASSLATQGSCTVGNFCTGICHICC